MRYVRERMDSGVRPGSAEALVAYVGAVVAAVERICREHRTPPSELPRPSRQAYDYLARLATSGARPPTRPPPPSRSATRVPSVVSTANLVLAAVDDCLVNRSPDAVASEQIGPTRDAVRAIEQACARRGLGPGNLPLPSRRAYALLSFLAADGVLARYAETVATVRAICSLRHAGAPPSEAALRIRLDDQSGVYRYRRHGEQWVVRLNPGFIAAPREILEAAMGEVFGRKQKERRAILHAFVHSEEFASVGQELDDVVAAEPRTKGNFYDLGEVCETVRRTFFTPPIGPPTSLAWTGGLTFHAFGHYHSLRDRITISRSLDDRSVPRYVVEFVMYHELLHKFHGIGWATSRRAMHTPAFRADEKQFPRYEQAQRFLDRLATKLRRRLR